MKQLIWDLPTRFFHWLLVGSVLLAFGIAELVDKDSSVFYFHVIFGVLAGLLIIWRIIWGFIGSRHSRWSELFFTPASIINYFKDTLTGKGKYYAGHNPGGALVVLGILTLVAITVITGVFNAQYEVLEELHESLPIVLMVFVGIHIAGVIFATKIHKENYAIAMITGKKQADLKEGILHSSSFAAILMLLLVFSSWMYFIKGFDRTTGLFSAPGTGWSYQIGEAEENSGGDKDRTESEGDESKSDGDED